MWDSKIECTIFTYEFATKRSKNHSIIVMAKGVFDANRAVAMIELLNRKAVEVGKI